MNNNVSDTKTERKSRSLAKKGLSLSVLTFLSRILGLVREITKSKFLGSSVYADMFTVAFQIPNFFRRLFAENTITVAFIPTFKKYLDDQKTDEDKQETQNFISATFTMLSFSVTLFVVLGMILTPLIIKFFFKELDPSYFDEAVILTRIMFPYLAVISMAALFQGILNGLKIFSPSGFTPILFNGIVIGTTYILAPHVDNPARAMSIGVMLGGTVQALFQLPFVLKNNWKITFTSLKKAFQNPGTKKVLKLIAPTIIGMAAYQLNDIVSTKIATSLETGSASCLSYSLRIQELILGLCAVTIGTIILPDLSGFAKKEDWTNFNQMLRQSIRIMSLIAIPATAYCLMMGEEIISTIYMTGAFDHDSAVFTNNIFTYHILGLLFISLNRIVSPAFYALNDTKNPTIAGLANFGTNIALALILKNFMGTPGVALALSIASLVNLGVLFWMLKKKESIEFNALLKDFFIYCGKMIAFSLIAAIPLYFIKPILSETFGGARSRWIAYGIPVLISFIIFATIGVLLLAATGDPIFKAMTKKFRKR